MRSQLTHWEQARAPVVAKLVSGYIPRTARVALDVGCGSGSLTKLLMTNVKRVIGVDIDYEAVHSLRDKSLCLVVGDATRLPMRSGTADFVFSYGALHHTPVVESLTEIVRVAAPGATVVLIDFCAVDTAALRGRFGHTGAVLSAFSGYRRRLGVIPALRITLFRLSPAWRRHQRQDVFLTPESFIQEYDTILSGATFHRDDNRITVVWRRTNEK
jgi:SAM-dependent methyltransferase